MNVNKLKGKMAENNLSLKELSTLTNIGKSTLYRKIKRNGDDITIREATAISRVLKLTYSDVMGIFFDAYVA